MKNEFFTFNCTSDCINIDFFLYYRNRLKNGFSYETEPSSQLFHQRPKNYLNTSSTTPGDTTPSPSSTVIAPVAVARNSILLVGFQVLTKFLGFLSSVFLANYFGVVVFGEYNYAFALTALFIPFCDLGMDFYLLREIPRLSHEQAGPLAGNVLRTKLLITMLVLLVIVITGGALEHFSSKMFGIIFLAGIVTLLRTYWTTYSLILRGINKVQAETFLYSILRLAEFCAVAAIVVGKLDMVVLLLLLSLINLLGAVSTYVIIRKRYLPLSVTGSGKASQVIMGGLPFALTGNHSYSLYTLISIPFLFQR